MQTDIPHPLKPLRWLAHLPLVILPFLAAAVVERPRLERDLATRVTAALVAAGQDWTTVIVDGRDIEIGGRAPNRAAADAARAAVASTFGVRRIDMRVGVAAP